MTVEDRLKQKLNDNISVLSTQLNNALSKISRNEAELESQNKQINEVKKKLSDKVDQDKYKKFKKKIKGRCGDIEK